MKKLKVIILSIAIIGMFTLPINVMADELSKTDESAGSMTALQDRVKDENAEMKAENFSEDSRKTQEETQSISKEETISNADAENSLIGGEGALSERKSLNNILQNRSPELKNFTLTKKSAGAEIKINDYDKFRDAVDAMDINDSESLYTIYMNRDASISKAEPSQYRSNNKIRLTSGAGGPYKLTQYYDGPLISIQENAEMTIDNITLDGKNKGQFLFISNNGKATIGKGATIQNFIDIDTFDGPPIHMTGGTLSIEEGAVIQNNDSNTSGGMIQAYNGTTINISGGIFRNNKTNKSDGGVIAAYGNLNITGGTFENNSAAKTGGAIIVGSRANATINSAVFKNNKASTAGAVYSSTDLSISNTIFEQNEANWGGAILSSKKLNSEKNKFIKNRALSAGGALYLLGDNDIKDTEFTDNKASTNGGAIYISKGNLNLTNSNLNKNISSKKGGALIAENAELTIDNAIFEDNYSKEYGGALCLNGDNNYVIDNSTIKNSKAQLGGGIFTMGGKLSVGNSTLENNVAEAVLTNGNYENAVGGAICSLNSQETSIVTSEIKNNKARNAAGVLIGSGTALIKGTEFNGNDTTTSPEVKDKQLAGGLYIGESANVTIKENSKFINNKSGLGGAIFDESRDYNNPADKTKYQNLSIENTTLFTGNEATIGLFNPPKNYQDFTKLQFSEKSDVPHNMYMNKSLLNNYDINYKGELLITYYANGGKFTDGKSIKQELYQENDTIKIIPAPIREGYKFLYWKGSEYQPGDAYTVKNNHTFVAQWEKIPESEPPTPKPPTPETPEVDGNKPESKTPEAPTIEPQNPQTTPQVEKLSPKVEKSKGSPQTGDANEVMMYAMLSGLSLTIVSITYNKKKKSM